MHIQYNRYYFFHVLNWIEKDFGEEGKENYELLVTKIVWSWLLQGTRSQLIAKPINGQNNVL